MNFWRLFREWRWRFGNRLSNENNFLMKVLWAFWFVLLIANLAFFRAISAEQPTILPDVLQRQYDIVMFGGMKAEAHHVLSWRAAIGPYFWKTFFWLTPVALIVTFFSISDDILRGLERALSNFRKRSGGYRDLPDPRTGGASSWWRALVAYLGVDLSVESILALIKNLRKGGSS